MAKKNKRYFPKKLVKSQKAQGKKILDLRSVLQSIYHDYINLETTCSHRCECCNVAMPQVNYSEFVQIVTVVWNKLSKEEKIELVCKSVEYFFRNEYKKWGKDSLVKPCMFLDSKGLCKIYEDRPLNCRMYGLWPKDDYERRVDRFEAAYKQYGLERKDLPLNTQCPNVKRVDETVPLTIDIINELFKKLDDLDKDIGGFSTLQVDQKENYRTFHDWLLLKIYGEKWLILLTTFMLGATREQMEDQIIQLKKKIRESFSQNDLPDIVKVL
jgi:Fe-S-cluster containining protein